jgi:hypothetical protein
VAGVRETEVVQQHVPGVGEAAGRPLVFLHIPRTGGTTLTRLLKGRFAKDQIFVAQMPAPTSAAQQFAALPEPTRQAVRLLLIGHHEYTQDAVWPADAVYITMLRDPVKRIVSTYRFIHEHPADPLYATVVGGGMSLREFVTSELGATVNDWQARCLAGEPPGAREWAPDVLDRSIRHVEERFALVGLSERFDETVALLGVLFDWQGLHYAPLNVSRTEVEVRREDEELIRELNPMDVALYEFAARRLEGQLESQPAVRDRLARLSRQNIVHAPLDRAYQTARRILHARRAQALRKQG